MGVASAARIINSAWSLFNALQASFAPLFRSLFWLAFSIN